jgi:hypothetical protein
MKTFMMIFRHVPMANYEPSQEEIQASIQEWQNWIGGIAAQGQFVSTSQLGYEGKTLHPGGVVTDGPYAELKEIVGGNIVVKAEDLDAAMRIAEGCPMLQIGGNVEVRDMMELNF